MQGQLTGKIGSVMVSTATQHGGRGITLFTGITNLMHFGIVIIGPPCSHQGQMMVEDIAGGLP